MEHKQLIKLIKLLFQCNPDSPIEDDLMFIFDEITDLKVENAKISGKLEALEDILKVD